MSQISSPPYNTNLRTHGLITYLHEIPRNLRINTTKNKITLNSFPQRNPHKSTPDLIKTVLNSKVFRLADVTPKVCYLEHLYFLVYYLL